MCVPAVVVALLVGPFGAAPARSAGTAGTVCTVGPRAEPSPTRPRYDVEIDLDPAAGRLRGRSVITFTPDLPTDRIVLRLWPNGGVRGRVAPRLTVEAAELAGRGVTPSQPDPTTLVIAAGGPLTVGAPVEVSVVWTLLVPGSRDDRVSRSGSTMRLGSFMPLLAWEPGVGWNRTPATTGKAESSMTATADWLVTVHPPQGGDKVDILGTGEDDGSSTWTATATRDWAMSVGHFKIVRAQIDSGGRDVQVSVGVDRAISEDPSAYLARVGKALRTLGSLYGPYPWSTYTLAITPGLEGGIEYPAHVMQGPGSVGRTTPHEVAHQWFYGLVGDDQGRDPWLDEGLASWAEARVEGTLSAFVAKAVPVDAARRVGQPMTFWDLHQSAYYRGVYVQTVQALAKLGPPDRVDCALRKYVATNAYRVARPADLLAALSTEFPTARDVLRAYGVDAG